MPARHAVLSTHSVSSRPTQLHSSSQSAYESPQFPVFVFKRLRTLSFSVSRKSCVCHSLVPSGAEGYEKCRVCTNNSHSGTCGSPVIARKQLKFFLFKFLRTLLHAPKCQRLCFQAIPHSLHKTPGVGGLLHREPPNFVCLYFAFRSQRSPATSRSRGSVFLRQPATPRPSNLFSPSCYPSP